MKQYTEAEVRKLQDEGALELRILSIAGFPGFCLGIGVGFCWLSS